MGIKSKLWDTAAGFLCRPDAILVTQIICKGFHHFFINRNITVKTDNIEILILKLFQFFSVTKVLTLQHLTRSHPETVSNMSRVTLNFDLSKIPFVHFYPKIKCVHLAVLI